MRRKLCITFLGPLEYEEGRGLHRRPMAVYTYDLDFVEKDPLTVEAPNFRLWEIEVFEIKVISE
jgi:hypothetical protein